MKKTNISLVASFLLATNLYSQTTTLQSVKISANTIETEEKKATFATEVYTKKDIEQSKSKDIYDFLASQTSVNVMPNFGNTFSQSLDMRGYGIENGYQNIAVVVNGRRLNNIDMVPQLLSSIPLESIEKIEILKGSGSVKYGDGANAGVISITTDKKNSNYIKTSFGDNFTKNSVVSLGYGNEYVVVNAYIDYSSTNGNIEDLSGKSNENYIKNKNFNFIFTPTESLELSVARTYSNMSIKYGNPITLDQFKNNPNLSPNGFNEQYFSSYVTSAGIRYDFNSDFYIDANFSDEDKISNFITWSNSSKYEYKSFNSSINYKNDIFKTSLGVDGFKGKRIGNTNTTSKDNMAGFASFEINATDDLTFSTGFRRENVEYEYEPLVGNNLKQDNYLNAYDFGVNYALTQNQSIFANYNRGFQAPDIDRFFLLGGGFNGFIEPAKVNNYTVGYNNFQENNKLKIALFRTNLKNEIYSEPMTFNNTNIDKSHKYGVEIYDKFLINENLYTSLNYSYIKAKIDEEKDGNGAYDGKDLPGVSKHNLTLSLGYSPIKNFETILSHSYRSSTYAIGDFKNNFYEKQKHYHSTDLSFNFKKKNVELFVKIQNLFDQKNGLWVANTWGSSDTVYPVNFERTFFAGMKVNF
ncbi:TonB-dependent receptor [Aliarcobacter skirrowii]|uniref:TonB-dependent receptor n=1 Tax=Aliarcobacter skirrowii TaxID=28200 RepID=UPI002A317135|nr:TonB-dependent receptor [Aliarcobacter skirrowii]MDD3025230.1 TonB-dependent receptor [Aliarcobacter skirrowii]MDY0179718.1 TonB-dependent receptor [Aliarcobacter skirrowii]